MKIYTVFHLNLAYSSIEEETRPEVIRKCYWPLLRLSRDRRLPFGIEASAYTLQEIERLDPAWIEELRSLCERGSCEFVGSGYSQMIGPLVPCDLNHANLRFGLEVYQKLLGFRPELALINEQAYSPGLLQHYLDVGYRGLIMEWDNPARAHSNWPETLGYLPQLACGQSAEEIPVLWNKSIAFQKFQRYAHGQSELSEYLIYLEQQFTESQSAFPLYGNDAEIFDFRPGRYDTEPEIREESEWTRIAHLYEALQNDPRFELVLPTQVLELIDLPGSGNRLHLESADQPIPVKKQGKYNITRWAVTGPDDLRINTECWQIYERIKQSSTATDSDWRELCYLWSSDFRTHITQKRWRGFQSRLAAMKSKFRSCDTSVRCSAGRSAIALDLQCSRKGQHLIIETKDLLVRFNCDRGLALDATVFKQVDVQPLLGTLPHGYFNHIQWSADYYSGHLVHEVSGGRKVTDLVRVDPEVEARDGLFVIRAKVPTRLGAIEKTWRIDPCSASLTLEYAIDWTASPIGSTRLGNITLNPKAFESKTLFYRTHNGGRFPELFFIDSKDIDHGRAVSLQVSCAQALGVTEGWIEIGDAHRYIRVEIDKSLCAAVGLVKHQNVAGSYFFRLAFSGGEFDDTCRSDIGLKLVFSMRISGGVNPYGFAPQDPAEPFDGFSGDRKI